MADKVSKSAAAATKHKAKASEEKSVSTAAKFKWNNEMVGALLDSLKEFKAMMEFNNLDFNADKPRQYDSQFPPIHMRCAGKYSWVGPLAETALSHIIPT